MRFPAWVTRNLGLKAFATVLATITWASVVYASNPPDTRSVTIKVPQDSGQLTPWVLVHAIPDLVLRVSGTREHLSAFNPSDLVVTVNYKSITHPGVQSLALTVVNNDRDVIMDTPPSTITAEVDRLGSRTVPVTIDVSSPPPQGYVVTSSAADPSTVTVIGPANQLAGIQAKVAVDLSNQKTNFQADKSVVLYDATNQRLGDFGTTVNTPPGHPQGTVQVTITVAASITSRASAVLPHVVGLVAPGHEVSGTSQAPFTVVLTGPQDLLNTLDSIPTDTISVNGLTSTTTVTVHIVTPSGVTATPNTVSVTITVVAVPGLSPSPTSSPTPTATSTPTPTPKPTPTPTPTPSSSPIPTAVAAAPT
jgi:YbbR domain-containing protein